MDSSLIYLLSESEELDQSDLACTKASFLAALLSFFSIFLVTFFNFLARFLATALAAAAQRSADPHAVILEHFGALTA